MNLPATLKYTSALESTIANPDIVPTGQFHTSNDKIYLSGTSAGTGVGIVRYGGSSFVYFDPDGSGVCRGLIVVGDVVQAFDVLTDNPSMRYSMLGSDGADLLIGGEARDNIQGGLGADVLYGRGGADVFRYASVSDSTDAQRDVIPTGDFVTGSDVIDLSAVAGAGVGIVRYAGSSFIYFAPDSGGVCQGMIVVGGVVQASDIQTSGVVDMRMLGSAGADTLLGGLGADVITGLGGADTLAGRAGNDVFVYTALSDSTVAASDTLIDFAPTGDVIDLSAIDANSLVGGNQAFTWATSFSGAAGEAVLTYDAPTNQTTLRVDVDGDGVADMRVLINGLVDHSAGWIL
jgi:Ca2+-binding RTX toxin-like protein